ncbi:acetyl/propionyl/methylcrotonyl-CoA carboxylase subunit alpha [Virgibacillus xinjiangensis]|uniref:biotin carboxylase n=1 Tax=Virgibacillus xinjiangensis TaxID=393090 RepID=A0ABV7CRD9_9BACI
MIKRLLIANRGEIASRIIRTCKDMDIHTIAVYSEADQYAPHVRLADESYLIGPSRAEESYMNMDKIMEAAKKLKADAIHPGYGFHSENPAFAERCRQEGIIFIGPSTEIIRKMGNKSISRKLMKNAGVPVLPGSEGVLTSAAEAVRCANKIGYPIMLKASAGGGGIGLQTVNNDEELMQAFASNSKRAKAFFGDGSMFLEKKLVESHHIEIQIIADSFGNVVHLFERECSIQRRNQKVLEEAPSPFISEETRRKMGKAAVKAAKALGYENVGTLEFLVDEQERFYFLEMNTRIQVEHPVTEEITGVDLVKTQIDIANGEKLQFRQEQLQIQGHAIETRIYAEDPLSFYPSPGHIDRFQPPHGENIRNEVAVTENYQVTPFYDPMIGKLIVKGETREAAIERLKEALDQYEIKGIKTNLRTLREVAQSEAFIKGQTTTSFIDDHYHPIARNKQEGI